MEAFEAPSLGVESPINECMGSCNYESVNWTLGTAAAVVTVVALVLETILITTLDTPTQEKRNLPEDSEPSYANFNVRT